LLLLFLFERFLDADFAQCDRFLHRLVLVDVGEARLHLREKVTYLVGVAAEVVAAVTRR
jgi:hypothetical protein